MGRLQVSFAPSGLFGLLAAVTRAVLEQAKTTVVHSLWFRPFGASPARTVAVTWSMQHKGFLVEGNARLIACYTLVSKRGQGEILVLELTLGHWERLRPSYPLGEGVAYKRDLQP